MPPSAPSWPTVAARLSDLLVHTLPDVQPADVPLLAQAGLSGEVASRLPGDHPLKAALQPAHLSLLARSLRIRRQMKALLAAWEAAGVPSVLLKGFALSEFVYPQLGLRPFGDVDILIYPEDMPRAMAAAHALGWQDDGLSEQPEDWTHETAHCYSPDGEVRLDVHRFVASWGQGPQDRIFQLTQALWESSQEIEWQGIKVRVLPPSDLALHLAVSRAWTGDAGNCKPADYPDLRAIIQYGNLTPQELQRRAAELGLVHTWRAYLTVCNPWEGLFHLSDAAGARRVRLAAKRDGRWLPGHSLLSRLLRVPGLLAAALPDVWAVYRQRRTDPRQLVKQWPVATGRAPLRRAKQQQIISGVSWLTRLLYPSSPGDCLPRSLATYRSLVRRGYPAVFVSGVRTEGGGVVGHAWIEGPQGWLELYEGASSRNQYGVIFEHDSGTGRSPERQQF